MIFLPLNTCTKAENLCKRFWCERRDLNPHARRRQILNLVRLPFRHSRKRFAEINRVQRVCDYCILRIHHPSIFGVIEPFNLRAYLPHLLFISHSNKNHLFYFFIIWQKKRQSFLCRVGGWIIIIHMTWLTKEGREYCSLSVSSSQGDGCNKT